MALAEARAAWQRTANRCLVQEDAKRAPKLACCSSSPIPVTQAETGSTDAPSGLEIPSVGSLPFDRNSSCSNLSPSSKWWLRMPPNYGYTKGMADDHFTSLERNVRTCNIQESPRDTTRSGDDSRHSDLISHFESPLDSQSRNSLTCEKKDFSVKDDKLGAFCKWNCQEHLKLNAKEDIGVLSEECFHSEVSKYSSDLYFDSESSWIGGVKNTPWWRTADAEELALLVARRSLDHIENCDLPRPQKTHSKNLSMNMCCPIHDEKYAASPGQKPNTHDSRTNQFKPGNPTAKWSCEKLRMSVGDQSVSGTDKALRSSAAHKRMAEMPAMEDDTGKAQLLEALRHSQTRAREAEQVAKQASTEKEHIIKLVLRQASQLFAYKQWIQLLQLENMYIQFENSKSQAASTWEKSKSKKGSANGSRCDYGVALAVGLGLIGAGLLLGWTIGWILPTCW
ncbi:uncharacterized protein LOC127261122 [Andrographis paniculata]|uniref:uncharacterized protein LOC127261122 n=1 Tax=Andrographis paniculata TaxID=175694 RepID=UPI0021E8890A|nr:uncharacterized protein LOC127261122 [Andrographis paniculata]